MQILFTFIKLLGIFLLHFLVLLYLLILYREYPLDPIIEDFLRICVLLLAIYWVKKIPIQTSSPPPEGSIEKKQYKKGRIWGKKYKNRDK